MRNRYQHIAQPSTGEACLDSQTLIGHAYEAEITRSQRPKLIKVAFMQELRDVAKTSKRRCRKVVKSTMFKVASSASRRLDKIAQKVAINTEGMNQSGFSAKCKSS